MTYGGVLNWELRSEPAPLPALQERVREREPNLDFLIGTYLQVYAHVYVYIFCEFLKVLLVVGKLGKYVNINEQRARMGTRDLPDTLHSLNPT
jgi:hypothetical protein